ncbi:MAG: hypothetical protein WBD56_12775 [Anaerolineales bacterium]
MAYTMNTTLGELMKDPKMKPIIDQYLPGVADNPMVSMVDGMTLDAIVSNPMAAQFGITEDKVEAILAQANKLA